MNAITLGSPNLFVKGMVEVIITDPTTGNIIGYDNVSSESAVSTSVNMGEVTGGFGNPLLINIPDTTRISGTLTSQAFSLQQRALTSGGKISMAGVIPYCETITASGNSLIVNRKPELAYGQPESDTNGWCYVRPHGQGAYQGTNYGVNLSTYLVDFTATDGTSYDVFYFTKANAAEVLTLPASFNPTVATVRLKYGVYAKQNNSVSNGTLQGYLYFVVPRAQFTGDAGVGANQTSNSTTDYNWTALMPDSNMMECVECGSNDSDYAYYIYAPCDMSQSRIVALGVVGGDNIFIPVGVDTFKIPLVAVYDNGYSGVPAYSDLQFELTANGAGEDDAGFSISPEGVITSSVGGSVTVVISAGTVSINATVTKDSL